MEKEQMILEKLDSLKADVDFIKEHIEDIILTRDDLDSIEEAERDLREGKTTSLEDLKKELEL